MKLTLAFLLLGIFSANTNVYSRDLKIDPSNKSIDGILTSVFDKKNVNFKTVENNLDILSPDVQQQKKSITGKVTDQNGLSLVGVTVLIKGTTRAVVTDKNGSYSIQLNENDQALVYSFIGMKKQEVAIDGRSIINLVLETESSTLDEIIVIGYGTAKRKDYSGSVSSVKMENSPVSLLPNLNALESLKGNVSGLNIGATNTAGGEPSILIRGQNSLKGETKPLIVLDGVIYLGSLSDINPSDIANYDVLKDAVSSAVYGSRSANGIIAITTKKGKTSKPTITFNASTAFQQWQNKPVMMKAAQWIELVNAANTYVPGSIYWLKPQEVANMNAGKETVWLDKISQTGAVQNYQISVSGASSGINYYLSTSYDDNKGVIVNDNFNRISVLGKLSTDITSWLQIGADANFTKRDYSGVTPNIHTAGIMSPYGVMFRDSLGHLEKYPTTQGAAFVNPLWGVNDQTRDNRDIRQSYRLNSYALLKAPWVKGLSLRVNFQNNLSRQETGDFIHEGNYIGEGDVTNTLRYNPATVQNYLTLSNGSLNQNSTYSYVIDNILNYNQTFNKHNIDVTMVATRDYTKYELKSMTGSDFSANGNSVLGYWGLHKATTQKVNNLDVWEKANIGYLGRLSYSYSDKYFFTGSYRRDGASVFGLNRKWGNFSAAGLAWKISNEKFLKSLKPLNSLKLKLSWGQNGNQGVGPYATTGRVANGPTSGVRYEFSNTGSQIYYGLIQSNMGNSNLGWESTEKWNGGLESVWLKNRLFIDLDIYTSETTDEIYTPTIPSMNGFTSITSTLGAVHNHGIELTLKTINIQNKDWNWNTSLTYWLNRNKLLRLDGQDLNNDGIEDDKITDGMFIGKPLNAIFGYIQDGIVQAADLEYKAMPGAATIDGYPKYKDISGPTGIPDGSITADDRTILGYAQENFRLNLSNSVSYKNFELYVMIAGIFGGGKYYVKSNTLAYLSTTSDGFSTNMSYRPFWTTENPSNIYPAAFFKGDGGKFQGLQSRSFVRVQNISLSYTLKREWLEKFKLNSFKIFCTANNPLIFTKWVGGDPEIGTTLLANTSPVASTYSLGVNISF